MVGTIPPGNGGQLRPPLIGNHQQLDVEPELGGRVPGSRILVLEGVVDPNVLASGHRCLPYGVEAWAGRMGDPPQHFSGKSTRIIAVPSPYSAAAAPGRRAQWRHATARATG